ncbi:MAG: hypothetical protein J6D15_00110 [Clostridia bacterium]|nr:hypothetical protein [Clostridia bacterium]
MALGGNADIGNADSYPVEFDISFNVDVSADFSQDAGGDSVGSSHTTNGVQYSFDCKKSNGRLPQWSDGYT